MYGYRHFVVPKSDDRLSKYIETCTVYVYSLRVRLLLRKGPFVIGRYEVVKIVNNAVDSDLQFDNYLGHVNSSDH